MVSLETTLSTEERSFYCSSVTATAAALIDLSKKRKREDQLQAIQEESPSRELKLFFCTTTTTNSSSSISTKNNTSNNNRATNNPQPTSYVELQLEDAPLPPDWQRCLDIKSGQITFYNTRTQSRTSRDPRRQSPPLLSLDLNLSCELEGQNKEEEEEEEDVDKEENVEKEDVKEEKAHYAPLWASPRVDNRAMVAAVCMRCHMLVMMCKASPSCPNCKFLHPQTPSDAKHFLSNGK